MLRVEDHVQVLGDQFGQIESKLPLDMWAVRFEECGTLMPVRDFDLQLVCPFDGTVTDSDWRACPDCKEII